MFKSNTKVILYSTVGSCRNESRSSRMSVSANCRGLFHLGLRFKHIAFLTYFLPGKKSKKPQVCVVIFIFSLISFYLPHPPSLLHSPSAPRLQSVRNFNTHLHWSHSQGSVGLSLSQTHRWHDSRPPNTHSGLTACCCWSCLVINKQLTVGGGVERRPCGLKQRLVSGSSNTSKHLDSNWGQKYICINTHID